MTAETSLPIHGTDKELMRTAKGVPELEKITLDGAELSAKLRLKGFIDRIERLETEKAEIANDIK